MKLAQGMRQTQVLAPQMRQGLSMLQKTVLELRAELQHQMETNPVIEDVVSGTERIMSAELPEEHASGAVSERELDFTPDGERAETTLSCDDADRDYFLQNMENFSTTQDNGTVDPDAPSRRQLMFDRQVKGETLQEHLLAQIPLSDIPAEDRALAELLVEQLDDRGYFTGSIPDIQMVNSSSEARILDTLRKISRFDPVGCGGRDLRECLLFQMDKLDDSPWEDEVRALVDRHLPDIANRRVQNICTDLGISPDDYEKALRELRKLDPIPGRNFDSSAPVYVVPEVFLARSDDGRWIVRVPDRNLPELRISRKYLSMLKDPKCSAETKSYIRERIAAAETLISSIEERQETIRKIAQAIVDVQADVFDRKSLAALHPLTMEQIAEKTGVHNTTVSRTVRDKYMWTPFGAVELRKLFAAGLSTDGGEAVSNVSVKDRIRQMIDAEDGANPLSDDRISKLLKEAGISCARRTVAKYREALGIPAAKDRSSKP